MLVEDAVPAPDGPSATSKRIPGETNARRRVQQMALHATGRDARGDATLHNAIGKVANRGREPVSRQIIDRSICINRGLSLYVVSRIKIESLMLFLAVCTVKT